MNYQVIAQSGLKVRGGPGTEYEEAAERLLCGDVIIGADQKSPYPAWLPILLEDDAVGWVARQYLQPVETDYLAQEIIKIQAPASVLEKARAPIMQNQLTSLYGYPKENAGYLKIIDLREFAGHLAHVRDFQGNQWSCRIWGHEALEVPLKLTFGLLCERGLSKELKTYDGCHCIRPMKSGKRPSVHAWGLAVDFNARTNPYQGDGSEDLITDFSMAFVRCFAEAGFEWGGLWTSIHDAMHFQLPWTQDWRQSDNPLCPLVSAPSSQPQLVTPGPEAAPPAGEPVDQSVDFSTKDGTIAAIQAECQKQGIGLPEQVAYVLGTVEWETGKTFKPVREAFWKDEAWRRANLSRYYPYYGRGYVQLTWKANYEKYAELTGLDLVSYVQLTWKANYEKYAELTGLDLVNSPDMAMDPKTALFILVHGFRTGAFTGKKITDYITAEEYDFFNARRCINGVDKAEEIAALADKYLEEMG